MTEPKRRIVLVTRPAARLPETMAQVQGRGWSSVACPVLKMHEASPLPHIDTEAIAITSAQALPALRLQPKERLILAVGEKTARRAREAGFVRVVAAGGKRDAFVAVCRAEGIPGKQVSFVCGRGWQGQEYSGSVADYMGAQWIEGYRVERMSSLVHEAERALAQDEVEAVLFYSAETVRSFLALCPPHLREHFRNVRALCLSEAISQQAHPHLWRSVEWGDPVSLLGNTFSGA